MKTILFYVLLLVSGASFAATTDTIPPFKKDPAIPKFSILAADSTWFVKAQLQPKKPLLLLYFSPDCGHCQQETEELVSRISKLKNLQVVMITSKPYDEMKNFSDSYKLERFPNIKVGTDPNRLITRFYEVKFTPFSAVYDRKGKLVKTYEKGLDWDEFAKLVK
jgi:thiol-disulfide isomerase/thioredoxin